MSLAREGVEDVTDRYLDLIGLARNIDGDHTGLVRSIEPLACTVTVVALDVGEVVTAAGGWICDRIRAGWRVSALVPRGRDTRPLRILGADVTEFARGPGGQHLGGDPASVAMSADLFSTNGAISDEVRQLQKFRGIEIVVWGDGAFTLDQPAQHVQHQLSQAATRFKERALAAASLPPNCSPTELFHSSGSWYSLEHGADFQRVAGNADDAYSPVSTAL